jgi:hypothetical protein
MCVHTTVMRQRKDGTERVIVHLFNNVNTTGGHAFPNDDVPLREESIPIRDIRVTFRAGSQFKSIRAEPEGAPLTITQTANGAAVTLPRLDIHTMIVAE